MPGPTRWGVVGAGRISTDFSICIRSMSSEEHQIVAVAGRNFENAKRFGELHGISNVYATYEELAQDADVEVAYVGNLHPDHYATVNMLLEHDKHVLCEKPLTSSRQDTADICKKAEQRKLFLMEAIWTRFVPAFKRMREALAAGEIGDPRYVHVTVGYPMQGLERVFRRNLGGSAVLTMGTYCANAILEVFGPELPTKISSSAHFNDEGVETTVAGTMRFSGNRLATFAMSSIFDMPSSVEIAGTKGLITLHPPSASPVGIDTPSGKLEMPFPPLFAPVHYKFSSGLRYEIEEVRSCLLQGLTESPLMSHKDSVLIASVLDVILKEIGVHI